MQISQNDLEHIKDMMQRGEMTAAQANVAKVRAERVHLVTSRMPSDVRKVLNEAVKRGELGHVKKDGHKPEAYFHPTFEYLVAGERNEHERSIRRAVSGVLATRSMVDA